MAFDSTPSFLRPSKAAETRRPITDLQGDLLAIYSAKNKAFRLFPNEKRESINLLYTTLIDVLSPVTKGKELSEEGHELAETLITTLKRELSMPSDSVIGPDRVEELVVADTPAVSLAEFTEQNMHETVGSTAGQETNTTEPEASPLLEDVEELMQKLKTKISTIQRFEYDKEQVIHAPTQAEQGILQKGYGLRGELTILKNQINRYRIGQENNHKSIDMSAMQARFHRIQERASVLFGEPAVDLRSPGSVHKQTQVLEPLILTDSLRVETEPRQGSVKELYEERLNDLEKDIDKLLRTENLPSQTKTTLTELTNIKLPTLKKLSFTDPNYLPEYRTIAGLLESISKSTTPVPIADSPLILGAEYAVTPQWPETKRRLISNRALIATLVLSTTSIMTPNKVSEYHGNVPVSPAAIDSTLGNIGSHAVWGSNEVAGTPVAVVEDTNELIRIPVRPYTRDVVEEETATVTPAIASNQEISVEEVTTGPLMTAEEAVLPTVPIEVAMPPSDTLPTLGIPAVTDRVPVFGLTVPNPTPTTESLVSLSPLEHTISFEVAPSASVIEVQSGNALTYPDRAIDTVFATVDTKGLPEVLVKKLMAQEKAAFLHSAERLKAAGVASGKMGVTFPGEKINYTDPKASLEQRISEMRQYLNVPHTEVAEEGDNLTKLTLQSFARDLVVLPNEVERLGVVEEAIAAYLKTPNARETLQLENTEHVPVGAVVSLQGLAPFLAATIAEKVRSSVETSGVSTPAVDESLTTEMVDTEVATDDFETSDSLTTTTEVVTSVENYPGGVLAYSEAYNKKLKSLGIAPIAPSMIDSWFQSRTPDNRILLEMTVGELTKIMMQTPAEIAHELDARKVSIESAHKVYELVIEARSHNSILYGFNSDRNIEEIIRTQVFADVTKNYNT